MKTNKKLDELAPNLHFGVNKFQYSITNDTDNLKKLESSTRYLNSKYNYKNDKPCNYCGSSQTELIPGFLHDKSGFNFWIYSSADCIICMCIDCKNYFNSSNIRYTKIVDEVKNGEIQKLLDFAPEVLLPTFEQLHDHYYFRINGNLEPANRRAENTIHKFELNRSALVKRRQNTILNFCYVMVNYMEAKLRDPQVLDNEHISLSYISWMDLNFISENIEILSLFCLDYVNSSLNQPKGSLFQSEILTSIKQEEMGRKGLRPYTIEVNRSHQTKNISIPSIVANNIKSESNLHFEFEQDENFDVNTFNENIHFFLKRYTSNNNNVSSKYKSKIREIVNQFNLYIKGIVSTDNCKSSGSKRTNKVMDLFFNYSKNVKEENSNLPFIIKEQSRIESVSISGIRTFENDTFINLNNSTCILIGENGVGKSTIFELIKNMLVPSEVNLCELAEENTDDIHCKISYVDDIPCFNVTQTAEESSTNGTKPKKNIIYIPESRLSDAKIKNLITNICRIRKNKMIFNFITNSLIQLFNLDSNTQINFNNNMLHIENRDSSIPLVQLSSGYLSIFYIFMSIVNKFMSRTDVTFANLLAGLLNTIVLIDEIELHLHPKFKKSILGNLRSVLPDVHFIVSTHDPLVIQSNSIETNILVLKKADIFSKTSIINNTLDHRNMTTQQILSSPIFGLSTLGFQGLNREDVQLYYKSLQIKDWDEVEVLRNKLGQGGYFGKSYRELVALSAVDAYLSQDKKPSIRNIVSVLEDYDNHAED